MSIRRVALIFDNVIRPDTTGGYCLRALNQMVHVEHFLPQDIERIPRTGFDLYLNIDDGLRYQLPDDLRPCAWWVIDTHLDLDWALDKGHRFDWLFAAQQDGAERLRKDHSQTFWLPLACDPEIHKPHVVEKTHDVCFIGRANHEVRREALALVQRHFPNSFIGERYFDEFAKAYSASRIGFNRSIKNDVNMRVFETLGCGPLLVTNDLRENGQEELLQSDRHLITYLGADELLDKLRFYLDHDGPREKIAQSGHTEVLARHTYRHRMQSLLQTIERSQQVATVAVTVPVPLKSDNRQLKTDNSFLDSTDIIIKTFLRPQALSRLLRSILAFYPAAHVTIADDGNLRDGEDSDSRACCQLIDASPTVTLHSLPFAAGVTPGRNLLVDKTTRPFLLLLDDDFCFTSETRIEQFFERLKADPEIGVVAGACIDVVGDERRPRNSGGTLEIRSDRTLIVDPTAWRDEKSGLRDYVPHFALIRREVFQDVRWEGGLGAEHYDFCLQLQQSRWRVAQDLSVRIDHYHFTPSLPGYAEHRFNYAEAQQWLLRKWNLTRIVQNGQIVVERSDPVPAAGERQKIPSPHTELQSMSAIGAIPRSNSANGASDGPPSPDASSSRRLPPKSANYFDFARPEVAALVPQTARHILDIGCGAGRLGAMLKERQPAEVVGIELSPETAELARTRLDQVIERSVEDVAVDFPAGRFDCVICADILEHLREPADVLARIRRWLTPDGVLVASLPNVRHHSVVASLLDGNWTYEAAGLLDSDHVRFFTRREIEKLFYRQGFQISEMRAVPGPGHGEWQEAGRPGSVRIGGLQVEGLTQDAAEEFFTYQHLVVAGPAASPVVGNGCSKLTSIIIVTHNQLPYTQECIDSIRLRTDEPYELIFVDNGSTDGTVDYLRRVSEARLIENPDNRGFPSAVNQGLQIARGAYVLLLNNDTVVTTGWLRRMQDVMEGDPQIGLVGPCSNNVSGEQMVPVSYQDMAGLDGFAWEWGKQQQCKLVVTDRLIGFCLLIRRAVIDQIGLLDERFGIGCFEDDDLCLRARQAGWKAVIARAAFVHHYGSRTFRGSGIDLGAVLQTNREKFLQKWNGQSSSPPVNGETPGRDTSSANGREIRSPQSQIQNPSAPIPQSELRIPNSSRPRFTIERAASGGFLLKPVPPKLSLCMIVRDNETTIGPCLESIRPWVDEIVVVDTGSKDRTPEICRQYGARMFEFPWCDDFSAARNESVKHARGEWLFWMDSDDTITVECGRKLRELADGPHPESILGYVMQVHCPGAGDDGHIDVTVVDHLKLVRNRPDLRFNGRIHEQLLPAIRAAGGEVARTDIYVVHSGSDHSPEGQARKLDRDLRILNQELIDQPNHPFVLFNLGMTQADVRQFDQAIDFLGRCLSVSTPDESHLRKAYAILVNSLAQAGRHDEAWQRCQQGLALYPDDKELLFRSAMLHQHFGRLHEAAYDYLRVLNDPEEWHFTSIDRGLAGYKARHNLALVYGELGRFDCAEETWRAILEEIPDYRPAWRGLGESLLRQGKWAEVEQTCERLEQFPDRLVYERHILRGQLAAAAGDVQRAVQELRLADRHDPNNLDALQILCRVLFEQGDPWAAEGALRELRARDPADAATPHNLGTLLLRGKRYAEAETAFRESLGLRPRSATTLLELGNLLDARGARGEAAGVWTEVLRIEPTNQAAREALKRVEATAI